MLLNRENSGERWRKRRDGKEKVTGELRYLTDMTAEGMLYARVLAQYSSTMHVSYRSMYPQPKPVQGSWRSSLIWMYPD